jgi:gas vesicle protein
MSLLTWLKDFFVTEALQDSKEKIKEKAEYVIDDIKSTVTEGIEEVKDIAEETAEDIKQRARDKLGRFSADDPTTKKNEAYKE